MAQKPNIVMVHGAWADGSCWTDVIKILQKDGYNVTAPQFPLTDMDANLARLRQVLSDQPGPTLLVGHSFGGQIITSLSDNAPNAIGIVFIAAFGLDEGESIGALLQGGGPPTPALAHLRVDAQGFGWLPHDDFVNHFAADVDPVDSNVMFAVQQPAHVGNFAQVTPKPLWKTLPSWYMVAKNDQVIPPDAERWFAGRMGATTVEVESSHVPMVSQPTVVADLIKQAAEKLSA